MFEQEEYARELEKRANDICDSTFIKYLLYANFQEQKHKMLIGEEEQKEFCRFFLDNLYAEYSSIEKVDLIDYWKLIEYGRTNKKR